jgi:signal transduction histidine kinase
MCEVLMQLGRDIASLDHGAHVCMVYDSFAEQIATVAPYLRSGLERGDLCVYAYDLIPEREVAQALDAAGLDVQAAAERGALRFLDRSQTYLASGAFEPAAMMTALQKMEAEALAAGFSGLRTAGDMTWALESGTACAHVIEYEAILNRQLPGSRTTGMCQYDRRGFDPTVIEQVLRTHPMAVIRDRLLHNFYYEPPDIFLNELGDGPRVEWKIEQLLRVHEADGALLHSRDAAEASSRAKSRFLAVMSHELRTPLTGIIGYADLLESGLWGSPTETEKTHIRRIKASAWHLVAIIDEILTFSRNEAGNEPLRLETVDLHRLVRECAEMLESYATARQVELRVVPNAAPLEVETDAAKVRQIVLNVAGNALKFTEQGFVEISIEPDDEDVRIRVRDSGPGISPDRADEIFDAFVQLDQSNTRRAGGTGLGLTVSRSLARRLGGDLLLLESEPGAGSTFALTLPRSPE